MSNHQAGHSVNLSSFLATHSVFTVEDLKQYMAQRGSTNQNTRKALLTYYRSRGRIISIRRGLYATIPAGHNPDTYPIDPYLVTAKLAEDATLAYHTALEYYGKAYTSYSRFMYTSEQRAQPLRFRDHDYVRVPVPHALRRAEKPMYGVDSHDRDGVKLRVTSYERTFVDVLDRPELSGTWEEIWRSLESIEFFDLKQVLHYVKLLGNSTTAAKVGVFLDQHREALMVEDDILNSLRGLIPSQPHYLNRGSRSQCRLVPGWNILVPEEILNHSWDEVL
ncbi:MAG: transcriptional regulator [Spirochaetaceae bacterium]|nr:MAG: transcriptional regulator [Spirochaetaceae bacterium]